MLTVKDLEKRYGVCRQTIKSWEEKAIIPPAVRFGRIKRWREDDLAKVEQPSKPQAAGSNHA